MIVKYGLVKSEYSAFPKLEVILSDEKIAEDSIKVLELRKQQATHLPCEKVLSIFSNLIELDISYNRLNEMRIMSLVRSCPNLQKLNLDHNHIQSLTDIEKLGDLQKLTHLTFKKNPVSETLRFTQILEELMFPPSATTVSPVEIFTATYRLVPHKKEKNQVMVVGKNHLEYVDDLGELGLVKFKNVSDSESNINELKRCKRWMMALIHRPCPTRKIGKFKFLQELNQEQIKVGHIFQVTGIKKLDKIARNEIEEKAKLKIKKINEMIAEKEKITYNTKPNKKVQQDYLARYNRRKEREAEQFEPLLYLSESQQSDAGHNYLRIIFRIDQINQARSKAHPTYPPQSTHPAPLPRHRGVVYTLKDLKIEAQQLKRRRLERKQKEGLQQQPHIRGGYKVKMRLANDKFKYSSDEDLESEESIFKSSDDEATQRNSHIFRRMTLRRQDSIASEREHKVKEFNKDRDSRNSNSSQDSSQEREILSISSEESEIKVKEERKKPITGRRHSILFNSPPIKTEQVKDVQSWYKGFCKREFINCGVKKSERNPTSTKIHKTSKSRLESIECGSNQVEPSFFDSRKRKSKLLKSATQDVCQEMDDSRNELIDIMDPAEGTSNFKSNFLNTNVKAISRRMSHNRRSMEIIEQENERSSRVSVANNIPENHKEPLVEDEPPSNVKLQYQEYLLKQESLRFGDSATGVSRHGTSSCSSFKIKNVQSPILSKMEVSAKAAIKKSLSKVGRPTSAFVQAYSKRVGYSGKIKRQESTISKDRKIKSTAQNEEIVKQYHDAVIENRKVDYEVFLQPPNEVDIIIIYREC